MPVKLECRHFSGPYASLNGTWMRHPSRLEILRALLTVGYPSRKAMIRKVGSWRAIALDALTQGYFDHHLCTTAYFKNLEQSEKAAMSFLFAQAYSLWFAQSEMKLLSLVHVLGCRARWSPGSPRVAKLGSGPLKPRARPDFIGRCRAGFHVFESKGRSFESKGRSTSISSTTVSSALSQVSSIATVNGTSPLTRVAACFAFTPDGVISVIDDPQGRDEGYDLSFDATTALQKYYTFFLEPDFSGEPDPQLRGFSTVKITDAVTFGIDNEVLHAIRTIRDAPNQISDTDVVALLDDRRLVFEERQSDTVSVGADGICLRQKIAISEQFIE